MTRVGVSSTHFTILILTTAIKRITDEFQPVHVVAVPTGQMHRYSLERNILISSRINFPFLAFSSRQIKFKSRERALSIAVSVGRAHRLVLLFRVSPEEPPCSLARASF